MKEQLQKKLITKKRSEGEKIGKSKKYIKKITTDIYTNVGRILVR